MKQPEADALKLCVRVHGLTTQGIYKEIIPFINSLVSEDECIHARMVDKLTQYIDILTSNGADKTRAEIALWMLNKYGQEVLKPYSPEEWGTMDYYSYEKWLTQQKEGK